MPAAAPRITCWNQGQFLTTVYVDSQRETFSRSTRDIRGTIADKGDTIAYVALLSDSGLVTSVEVTERNPRRGVVRRSHLFKLPKSTMPLMHGSGALFEQLLRRVRALGGDSVSVPVMRLGREEVLNVITVTSNGPDSLTFSFQSSQSDRTRCMSPSTRRGGSPAACSRSGDEDPDPRLAGRGSTGPASLAISPDDARNW